MTYPIPNYSRIWVRGRIIDLGRAATEQDKYGVAGSVTFTPSPKVLVNAGTKQIIAAGAFRVTASVENGYFAILLPATDDPDVVPTDFTYRVDEPATGRSYNIKVSISTPILDSPGDPLHGQQVIDLSEIVPVPGPSNGFVQLVSGRGLRAISVDDGDWVAEFTDDTSQVIGPAPTGGDGSSAGPLVHHDFSNDPDGPVPTTIDSGQSPHATGSAGLVARVADGMVGYQKGITNPAGATYFQVETVDACVRMSGKFRFNDSPDTGGAVAIGFFSTLGVSMGPEVYTFSPTHVNISPTFMQNSVFTRGTTDYNTLTPVGHSSNMTYFPTPLRTDGETEYDIEILLDQENGRAYITVADFPTLEYVHPWIKQKVSLPFWESLTLGSSTNHGGFTYIEADTKVTAAELNAARGASRVSNGAGSPYDRPTSLLRPGSLFWNVDAGKQAVSTGSQWRDTATNLTVGNMLTGHKACATLDVTHMGGNATKIERHVVDPDVFDATTGYLITGSGGYSQYYITSTVPVVAGDTYTFLIDKAEAFFNAEGVFGQLNWFNASSAPVGVSNDNGAQSVIVPTDHPVQVPAVTAVAPAGATQLLVSLIVPSVTAGNKLFVTRWMVARGAHTRYLQP